MDVADTVGCSVMQDSDEDYIPQFVDSDIDLQDDDDLFAKNVDCDKGKDKVKLNFKSFREEDLAKPEFKVGQTFASVELLRRAIKEYSCHERVDIKCPRNDRKRVKGICEDGCPWSLYASFDGRINCFMIKKYNPNHTCIKKWSVKSFTAPFMAGKYLDSFRADENMNMKNFSRVVQKDWNMTTTRSKLRRARRLVKKVIEGDELEQYNSMWDYAAEFKRSNPGSSFYVGVNDDIFGSCYFSLDACKRGFMQACRPVICLDGCHLKTKYGGVMLCAVGMDPNDCIYPLAFAVVEVENTDTWKWFLSNLKSDLGILNTEPWTIMLDKQKELIKGVRQHFPDAEHRHCVRHIWQNFQQTHKGDVLNNQLWKCARSTTPELWAASMEEMKVISIEA
ncbi:uncharacterized protein [Aegilops tauschii subsp. strangulata]|uniref:uncharacterized protein n=1 Tax=Aegilops tauschii subsp. strangulata TaxID=200361 RepID=UPI000989F06A|nr:uncharacterized protein LOC109758763 [Aegilops tauschii subsp. strangulata]